MPIIQHLESRGYKHIPKAILYRSEGYPTFKDQPDYVLEHGIFSKKLVTRLIASVDSEYERELERVDWKEFGNFYKRAYEIKERKPDYFKETYEHLLHEVAIAASHHDNDLMDVLAKLHVGYNKWDSYLISTGNLKIAKNCEGVIYKCTPNWILIPPLTFKAKNKVGATKNAVLLWISSDDYDIEIVDQRTLKRNINYGTEN